jgi:hypothetical protein
MGKWKTRPHGFLMASHEIYFSKQITLSTFVAECLKENALSKTKVHRALSEH